MRNIYEIISGLRLKPLDKDILIFLYIKKKKTGKPASFKEICEKTEKSKEAVSESLKYLEEKSLIKEVLINKKPGRFSLYSLSDKIKINKKEVKVTKIAKILYEDRRFEIREAVKNDFIENEKLEKLIFISSKKYLKFPIKLKSFIKRYDVYRLLKEYIVHLYIEPLEKIEFMYKEECMEKIKKFWIKGGYLKEEKFLIDEILKRIENNKEKGIKLNVLEYIKKLFEENKIKIFKDFNEYSKNPDLWIERNMKISLITKIASGISIGIISSLLSSFIILPSFILFQYLFKLKIENPFSIYYNSLLFFSLLGIIIGIAYIFFHKKVIYYILSFSILLLTFYYLFLSFLSLYYAISIEMIYAFLFYLLYILLLSILYILLYEFVIAHLWNRIVTRLFNLEFNIWKIVRKRIFKFYLRVKEE